MMLAKLTIDVPGLRKLERRGPGHYDLKYTSITSNERVVHISAYQISTMGRNQVSLVSGSRPIHRKCQLPRQ